MEDNWTSFNAVELSDEFNEVGNVPVAAEYVATPGLLQKFTHPGPDRE
jgi:hypothetical protein